MLGVRFWPRLCKNYFRKIKVVFHNLLVAILVLQVGSSRQYLPDISVVVGENFLFRSAVGVFTQPRPEADPQHLTSYRNFSGPVCWDSRLTPNCFAEERDGQSAQSRMVSRIVLCMPGECNYFRRSCIERPRIQRCGMSRVRKYCLHLPTKSFQGQASQKAGNTG